jgi:sarcosine oxidase
MGPRYSAGDRLADRRGVVGLYQRDDGILDIRRANAAQIALARRGGRSSGHTRRCGGSRGGRTGHSPPTTAPSTAKPRHPLCGVWLPALLGDLGLDWRITPARASELLRHTQRARLHPRPLPDVDLAGEHLFYGFPVYGEVAVKAARDMTGRFVTRKRARPSRPPRDRPVASFLRDGCRAPRARALSKTCVYDMPPDRDFIVDRLPATRGSRSASGRTTPPSSRACSGRSGRSTQR